MTLEIKFEAEVQELVIQVFGNSIQEEEQSGQTSKRQKWHAYHMQGTTRGSEWLKQSE